jgi:predicted acylesterase/phospholipase RssA
LAGRELIKEQILRRLEHEYLQHLKSGTPFTYDVLVISGGGAKGSFGAGFLKGWRDIAAADMARPQFDMVTGVSTGALIAPFAFIGADESYAQVARFYANPEQNWAKERSFKFLAGRISLVNNCHLQKAIRAGMERSIVQGIADGAAEDRLLLIGATNLDAGAGRIFDLGLAARQALERNTLDRVHAILLASSAIPGVFPPIMIDGMLYADGGATSNLFISAFPGPEGPLARFITNHPEGPKPTIRIWILVNQRLRPQPEVTQPRWFPISNRALGTLTSTSQIFTLALIEHMAREARAESGVEIELRLVSIPEDAPRNNTGKMFDQEYMRGLQAYGEKMGADPASWQDIIPSAFSVQGDWLRAD